MKYTLHTQIPIQQTIRELKETFRMWGVEDWDVHYTAKEPKVTLWYMKNGRRVNLTMDSQPRNADNLRVLYLAVEAMRLNEKRGIGEVIAEAYKQLTGTVLDEDPYEVLGVSLETDPDIIEAIYKVKARKAHPDNGGSAQEMSKLNKAIEAIRRQE
jgi:hypothetical protein